MQAPIVDAEALPLVMTVNPQVVDAPAARLPLPFGLNGNACRGMWILRKIYESRSGAPVGFDGIRE
ncbi:hypothetical protein ACFVT1_13990 [Streptomyces sp. NPDC057963]|uniref:hypothetical protein n=1 Tax=Streptomyces sp. NPDC057963 TaxID=3346290 RepID=UPI0036ED7105